MCCSFFSGPHITQQLGTSGNPVSCFCILMLQAKNSNFCSETQFLRFRLLQAEKRDFEAEMIKDCSKEMFYFMMDCALFTRFSHLLFVSVFELWKLL
jgi:hypothetical protein